MKKFPINSQLKKTFKKLKNSVTNMIKKAKKTTIVQSLSKQEIVGRRGK